MTGDLTGVVAVVVTYVGIEVDLRPGDVPDAPAHEGEQQRAAEHDVS